MERGDWGLDLVLKSGERKVAIEPDPGRWKARSGKCGLNPIVKSGEWEVLLILIGSGKWKWGMVVGCDLHFFRRVGGASRRKESRVHWDTNEPRLKLPTSYNAIEEVVSMATQ